MASNESDTNRDFMISSGLDEKLVDSILEKDATPLERAPEKKMGDVKTDFSYNDPTEHRSGDLIKLADKVGVKAMDAAVRIHHTEEKVKEKFSRVSTATKDLINTIKEELGIGEENDRGL